jgi:hypothetical protein
VSWNKVRRSVTLAMIAAALTVSTVSADNVSNTLDASVDAIAEQMALNTGGPNGATTLYIDPTNGDGKNGCNLTGATTLVVAVASSNPAVATITPTSVTFTSCGATPALTVHPLTAGATTMSLTVTSNNTGASFNLAPATFAVNVAPPPNTAPTIALTGVSAAASYEILSVPAAGCSVVDAEDGNSSFAATLSEITGPLAGYGLGSQTASCSYTDAGELTTSASITYQIVDTAAPAIVFVSRSPVANGAGWNKSPVTLQWACSDSGSGAVAAAVSVTLAADGAGQSATGTCEDRAGNTATDTIGDVNIDSTPPAVALISRAPAANAAGWNNENVTVEWSCSDDLSGAVAATVADTVTTEGADQTAGASCEDAAGNETTATHGGISIDKTRPTITDSGVHSGTAGSNGWYVSSVVNKFTAVDGLSGIAGSNPVFVSTGTAEGTGITVNSGAFADRAGNTTPGIDSDAFKIDLGDPTDVTFSSLLDGEYVFGSVPPAPSCTAADAVSGLESCVVTGYAAIVGSHTLAATATDRAGRTTTISTTYRVLPWDLRGFYSPVDMANVVNVVKGGSTVPLKFEVFASTTELTSTSAIATFRTAQLSCGSLAEATDEIEILSTGGTSLRYDSSAGQFIQNWQTPKTSGLCYRATVTTLDGSSITGYFKTK